MPLRACALLPYKNVSDRCKTHVRWGEFSVYRFDIYISFFILFLFLQYEGAVQDDGRGPAIWDKFAHTFGNFESLFNHG